MHLVPHDPARVVATDGFWDPDCTNGLRAGSARAAVEYYRASRGMDEDIVINSIDLITDLLHLLHAVGGDPMTAWEKARGHFEMEAVSG
jgi:hypothetical protein